LYANSRFLHRAAGAGIERGGLYSEELKRIVLYFPQQLDPARERRLSRHLLPLPLLAIAGGPRRDGFEVIIVDGNLHPEKEAHAQVVEACEGAVA